MLKKGGRKGSREYDKILEGKSMNEEPDLFTVEKHACVICGAEAHFLLAIDSLKTEYRPLCPVHVEEARQNRKVVLLKKPEKIEVW